MSALFSDFLGGGLEIFLDDLSFFCSTLDACLENLKSILQILLKIILY